MKTTMWLPWTTPPIRSNNRMHWARKAAQVKLVRMAAAAQSHGLGLITGPVSVTLIWEVTDHRRRDVGAAGPTLKAWIDGCVDGGLLAGDSHEVVAEERLRIEVGTRRGIRVEIEAWTQSYEGPVAPAVARASSRASKSGPHLPGRRQRA